MNEQKNTVILINIAKFKEILCKLVLSQYDKRELHWFEPRRALPPAAKPHGEWTQRR